MAGKHEHPEKTARKKRPGLFRALGNREPAELICVDGRWFFLEKIIKHDSWAATALYVHKSEKLVCKFNRIQPIFMVPMSWLGQLLASREQKMYKRLADVENVPAVHQKVTVDGRIAKHAVAHFYVEGHPLQHNDRVNDSFFDQLRQILEKVHKRGMAYVDMHKCENIIVDESGNPHLIDFQISIKLPRIWPLSSILKILQKSDLYHLQKHMIRQRPDLFTSTQRKQFKRSRPWWIRAHRFVAVPFRTFRRQLLVAIGVRKRGGRAQSEAFVEEGLRLSSIEPSQLDLLKLHSTLLSDYYFAQADNDLRKFVDQLKRDLFGRRSSAPEFNVDFDIRNQVGDTETRSILILRLLHSDEFASHSNQRDSDFLRELNQTILESYQDIQVSDNTLVRAA